MCITPDGKYCPILSIAERDAQHKFEERKGPYPLALANRLHRQGIMPRKIHLRESRQRQIENVKEQLRFSGFYINMDCRPQERDFMMGDRHDLPRDPHLPKNLWRDMARNFVAVRKSWFLLQCEIGKVSCTSHLIAYPEFSDWFTSNAELILEKWLSDRFLV